MYSYPKHFPRLDIYIRRSATREKRFVEDTSREKF